MFDRFTPNSKLCMNRARLESQRLGHEYLGTEHMLLGLLTVDRSTAVRVLEEMKVDRVRLRAEVEKLITPGVVKPLSQLPFTARAKKVLELSMEEAGGLGHNYIGTEHLLLGLIREDESVAAIALKSLGVDLGTARTKVVEHLRSTSPETPTPAVARGSFFGRCTDQVKSIMHVADKEAMRFNHQYIGTEHILLGLVQERDAVACNVLLNMGVDPKRIRAEVEKIVKTGSPMVQTNQPPLTPRATKALEISWQEADIFGDARIDTEHLLLGLIRENEGIAAQVLANLGVKVEDVRAEVVEFLGLDPTKAKPSPGSTPLSRRVFVSSSIRAQIVRLRESAEILRRHGEHDLAEQLELAAKRINSSR
jgi:ATP-dependent Clp protease ATP-binding subunit ClpA